MICFLTSFPTIYETNELNPANGFAKRLRACVRPNCRALFVCSSPDSHERTDMFARLTIESLISGGISIEDYSVLDGRNPHNAETLIEGAGLIILAGGHVPTQNRFFAEIKLKSLLEGYEGVIMGISAGGMNSAEIVYAHPEEDGEATDPAFKRFIPGLGLTKTMLLPHYSQIKNDILDGLRVMEDIAYPDSMGREFVLLEDGSYILIRDGREAICGEAYILADGKITRAASV